MQTISFISTDIEELAKAEKWLTGRGYPINEDWSVKNGVANLEGFSKVRKMVVRKNNGTIAAHNHATDARNPFHYLDVFQQAILNDEAFRIQEEENKTEPKGLDQLQEDLRVAKQTVKDLTETISRFTDLLQIVAEEAVREVHRAESGYAKFREFWSERIDEDVD